MSRTAKYAFMCSCCFLAVLVGCMSSQPVYSPSGQYLGHRQQMDTGKTLSFLGNAVLGVVPFAKDAKAARDALMYGQTLRTIGNAARYDGGNEIVHYVNVNNR